ncbi:MAG: TonB-dependent receptor [Chitinophagaceae bacterium]|nr:TonB-dependent receptor [Chitinophagaceae bacterium]
MTTVYMRSAIIFIFLCACINGFAQHYTLTIQVSDSLNIPVGNATLRINQKENKVDATGKLLLQFPAGKCTITASAVGYRSSTFTILLTADTVAHVVLERSENLLQHVTIVASRNVSRNQMSTQSIGIGQLKKLPVLLGEIDPLKTITLLPGIKSGGEASAGIYVRGGGPDQNLVLLDGIPVYNPNHLLGFFSVFNGEAVQSVEVIKGGMPAEYGGRLSSVIAVETREGSKDSLKASGGIGLISSRLSAEGPVVKGRSSFIVSARRTYIDQVGRLVAKKRIGDNGYYFYDINAKLSFDINPKNKLVFTFYTGKDDFSFVDMDNDGRDRIFNAVWGNNIAGLSWKQEINSKLKQELSAVYNGFTLDSRFGFNTTSILFTSGLRDYQLKNDWLYTPGNKLSIKWGLQYTWHRFKPGAGGVTSGVQQFKSQISDQYAREAAAYISGDWNIAPKWNIIAGIRYSYFNQVGPTERVIYNEEGVPTGEKERFGKGESIAKYHYPEPRVSMVRLLPHNSSIKLSYTRTIQYLHLATTSGATFPSDLWIPGSKLIQPGKAQQVAAGYFRDFNNSAYEMSVETYYKTMTNQVEFKPGAQLLLNQNLEGQMIFGSGRAYGIELFLQKKKGKLTGWIGYTLSRAERTFPELNNGKAFPYRYDRTHDLSIVANYPLSARWEISGVFVYGTGNALTIPVGRFTYNLGYHVIEQKPIFSNINQYDKVNDYRMPAYHRLDVSFVYTPRPLSTKRFKSSWNFGIYNVYNRYNPYFIYLDVDNDEQMIKGKKVFLFPVMPSVTWNFKF